MARDIDAVQNFVRTQRHIPPVQRQVLLGRIEQPPTRAEIDAAKAVIYPDRGPESAEDLLLDAWGVIANAGHGRGNWDAEDPAWVDAAERWRDRFHAWLDTNVGSASNGRMQIAVGPVLRTLSEETS